MPHPSADQPAALVIRTAGTNCDAEMVRAFELAGARADLVHVDRLIESPARLDDYDLIGFPGGFSYGDDVASGRVLAMRLRLHLYPALRAAALRGAPMIGVCNGFQALVQLGMLPGPERAGDWPEDAPPAQSVALTDNISARFIDDWTAVEIDEQSPCVWTRGLVDSELPEEARARVLLMPLASGEGRFVAATDEGLKELERRRQVPMRYAENLNGSMGRVAGICDASGLIFGLMPHPDRYLDWMNHPFWTRLPGELRSGDTPGLRMFRAAVEHVKSGGAAGSSTIQGSDSKGARV
ncbi:MAG: phosphoribosylformylglycinamidine synthase subunit PurQ [Phycisphaeraceae bacterium]|nr:MAG: phosphoribosylformylglycinamidine synthase subunit PurQ [Phycisphaeraceae bacterium]